MSRKRIQDGVCQVRCYQNRSHDFGHMNFLDFCLRTYDAIISTPTNGNSPPSGSIRRVLRPLTQSCAPEFKGSNLPGADDLLNRDFYFASMILLLSRWENLRDIKGSSSSFEDAYKSFLSSASQDTLDFMDHTKFWRKSMDAADLLSCSLD